MDQDLREQFLEMLREPKQRDEDSGIHSIQIDLDNNILKINGKTVKRRTVVCLPATDGFYHQKLFNFNVNKPQEESNRFVVQLFTSNQ